MSYYNLGALPDSPAARVFQRLAALRERIDHLERSRPVPSSGAGDPTGVAQEGTTYTNETDERAFVYGSGGWVNLAVNRQYDDDMTESSSTIGTTWNDLGGPSITLDVPSGRFVALAVEVEVQRATAVLSRALLGIREATDIFAPVQWAQIDMDTSAWYGPLRPSPFHVASNPGTTGRMSSSPFVFRATTGVRTYVLRFKGIDPFVPTTARPILVRDQRMWGWIL